MKFLLAIFNLLLCTHSAFAQNEMPNILSPKANQSGFLENFGQVRDFDQKPVEHVFFEANFGNKQIFITDKGLSFLFSRVKKTRRIEAISRPQIATVNEKHQQPADSQTLYTYELERVDLVLKNGSISKKNIEGKSAENSPIYHFYVTEDVAGESVTLKSDILIKEVYPGIDWKLYIKTDPVKGDFLKHEFIVHPGANPAQISLQYSDNAKPELSGEAMQIKTTMGQLLEDKPYTYQLENKVEIPAAYNLQNNNTIGYQISAYDLNQTLVIDPSIFWLTYIHSSGDPQPHQSLEGEDVETDSAGNIFVLFSAAGNLPFPTLNPGNGAYYQEYTASPNGSVLITKFAPGGQMLWSTFFGNWICSEQMTVDKDGNIIAIGRQIYPNAEFPNPNPSFPLRNSGGYFNETRKTYFIAKFTNTGILNWSSWYLGFSSFPTDMSYDLNGNIYVAGWSKSHDFPNVDPGGGAYMVSTPQHGSEQVLFIAQFNSENKLTWSTRVEGSAYDPLARVCTDKLGNIYLGGQARSNNFPLVNAGGYFNQTQGNVLAKFNPSRQLIWSTYLPDAFRFKDLTTDDSCNLYVAIGKKIFKFDPNTNLVFENNINNHKMYSWEKIQYDSFSDQIHVLGIMNDSYVGFSTINTACGGSFYYDGLPPRMFNIAVGPIFGTIDKGGNFIYLSLVDWGSEYYNYNEMTTDREGNIIYLFGNAHNNVNPNPQVTDPGNGAYFNSTCGCTHQANPGSLLLKLEPSTISVKTEIMVANECGCETTVLVKPECGVAPFTYNWSTSDTTALVRGLCPGNYWVTVTDANKLSRKVAINIPIPENAMTSITATVVRENCTKSNGIINIEAVQGGIAPFTYSIDGVNFSSNSTFSSLDSGNHIIYVKDQNGCNFQDTVLIGRVNGPTSISFQTQSSTCIGADGQVEVANVQGGEAPYKYILNNSDTNNTGVFKNLMEGSYLLTVFDSAGCQLSSAVTITQTDPPTDVVFQVGNDPCKQGKGFLLVTEVIGGIGPFTYSTDGITYTSDTLKNLSAGSYTLYIKDKNDCLLKKDNIEVVDQAGPSGLTTRLAHAYCGKQLGSITIEQVEQGIAPYLYSLNNEAFSTVNEFTNLNPGIHHVAVIDNNGCSFSTTFQINYLPIPLLALVPADTVVCYNENIQLSMEGELEKIKQIQWNIPAANFAANLKVNDEKMVIVTITDSNACIIRDTAIIKPQACNPPETCLVIPNAFTPNNDGKNETIGPIANGCRIKSLHFYIYNRWGTPIFETKNLNSNWDGKYKDVLQPTGSYAYLCIYETEDGIRRQQKGTILLIR